MSEEPEIKSAKDRTAFSREVGAKAARKLKARVTPRRASGLAWA